MRTPTGRNPELHPDDVAWVVEWQLAQHCRWVPVAGESPVVAAPRPDGKWWRVRIRAGRASVDVRLPVRDLARVVQWCHRAPDWRTLHHPPALVRPSLVSLRTWLRAALRDLDPLGSMGYSAGARER
ncbi:MAG: hypothetical protein ACK47B_26905 [Armatimonadota bacterium]